MYSACIVRLHKALHVFFGEGVKGHKSIVRVDIVKDVFNIVHSFFGPGFVENWLVVDSNSRIIPYWVELYVGKIVCMG